MPTNKKTNKEYLLTMLTTLEGKWAAAKGVKVLVEKNLINEKQIMKFLQTFLEVIYQTHTKIDLRKFEKTIKK